MVKKIVAVAIASVIAGAGGGQSNADTTRESPLGAKAALDAFDASCAGCAFGPVTFVRRTGRPNTERVLLHGDPNADYVIGVNDNGSQGANATVTLDGVVLQASPGANPIDPRQYWLNVKLQAQSVLEVRLTGKPGSTLTVSIRGGTKIVGRDGGSVTSSGSIVSLEIPRDALKDQTQISIAPPATTPPPGSIGASAFDLGPPGIAFDVPVTLVVKYDPTLIPADWAQTSVTIAVATTSTWNDLPTTVDTSSETLTAKLSHFSTYAYKQLDRTALTNPVHLWANVSGSNCWISDDAGYNNLLAELGRLLFGLATPSTTGKGCVTEPYLADGYSFYHRTNENHAGIDFSTERKVGTPVYAVADGSVENETLDAANGHSTLTFKSVVAGRTYRVLYLHCNSHNQVRAGVDLGQLTAGKTVLKGDQVCQSGSIGAGSPHLHFEVKALGMDNDTPSAVSGGPNHCQELSFYRYNGQSKRFDELTSPGCHLAYIGSNTVDPTVLLQTPPTRVFKQIDYPGSSLTQLWSINRFGQAVGGAVISGKTVGFFYSNGSFISLPTPFNASGFLATGITEDALIVGFWCSTGDCLNTGLNSGFILDSSLTYSSFTVPDSLQTNIRGISSNGRYLAGDRLISNGSGGTVNVGWTYDRALSKFSFIGGAADELVVQGVNNSGQAAGSGRFSPSSVGEGFLFDIIADKRQKLSAVGSSDNVVQPRAINNLGGAGGHIVSSGARIFYFTMGEVQYVDIPGGVIGYVYGGNDAGQLVGFYRDASGHTHGFLLE